MAPVNISDTKKDNQTPSTWKKHANINFDAILLSWRFISLLKASTIASLLTVETT